MCDDIVPNVSNKEELREKDSDTIAVGNVEQKRGIERLEQ